MLIVTSKKLVTYDFSSVQFDLPKTLANKVIQWGKNKISDDDLYKEEEKFGQENEIHVTVKYGLHTNDPRKVQKIVDGFGPFQIQLGKISRFVPKDKDFDVVKIEINSDKLSELHRMIGKLPNSDEHPVYNAHCTIAYVKSGCCSDLSGNSDLAGNSAMVSQLTFSATTGKKTEVPL